MAFHPYPHLIQLCCSTDWFRPPDGVTRPSPWAWIDRSASRLQHATYSALFGLGFPTPSPNGLSLPHTTTPWLIFQEARSRTIIVLPLACRSMVSGSLSLPFRGSFHLSLAVLCAIGQPGIFSLTQWSGLIPTTFHGGSGTRDHILGRPPGFAYGAFTLYGVAFQLLLLPVGFVTSPEAGRLLTDMSHYPDVAKAAAMALRRFRLFPVRSPLLRESLSVSFPRATKRFYFARFGSSFEDTSLWAGGFPHSGILGSTLACSSPSLSQLATPFIPSGCLGIHHGPLAAWPFLLSTSYYLIQLPRSFFLFLWRRGDLNP